jgi:hypothetical protein
MNMKQSLSLLSKAVIIMNMVYLEAFWNLYFVLFSNIGVREAEHFVFYNG